MQQLESVLAVGGIAQVREQEFCIEQRLGPNAILSDEAEVPAALACVSGRRTVPRTQFVPFAAEPPPDTSLRRGPFDRLLWSGRSPANARVRLAHTDVHREREYARAADPTPPRQC